MEAEDHHMRRLPPLAAMAPQTASVVRSLRRGPRARLVAGGLAASLFVLLGSVAAYADGWSSLKGRVVISDTQFGSYSSDAEMVSAVS